MTLVSTVGGAAGPLYGTLFLAMAGAAGARDELAVAGVGGGAASAGVAGVRARGKAEPGDKTMLDALLPAVEALDSAAAVGQPLGDGAAACGRGRRAGYAGHHPARCAQGPGQLPGRAQRRAPGPGRDVVVASAGDGRGDAGEWVAGRRRVVIGLVLVCHSAKLAEGVAELAAQMSPEGLRIAVAGGLDQPGGALGTDALRVVRAVDEAWSPDGVLILMDLGSAVLSAEMALDLLPRERRERVLLSAAPLVEGAVAAAVAAGLGDPLETVAAQARGALAAKAALLPADGGLAATSAAAVGDAVYAAAGAPPDRAPADTVQGPELRIVIAIPWACTRARPPCWCARRPDSRPM